MQEHPLVPSLISRRSQTSSDDQPSTSRSEMTVRCAAGSVSMAASTRSRVSPASSSSSGSAAQLRGGVAQWPGNAGWSAARNRSGSTAGESSSRPASDENGTDRASRRARVRAWLARMRKIQVRSDERPSNRGRLLRTPIHVSWTTSSATARVRTYMSATRISEAW